MSQPLHFGDYGGMPLKIVWALLDAITIVVLGSGLYLWLVKRRRAGPELAGDEADDVAEPAPRAPAMVRESVHAREARS